MLFKLGTLCTEEGSGSGRASSSGDNEALGPWRGTGRDGEGGSGRSDGDKAGGVGVARFCQGNAPIWVAERPTQGRGREDAAVRGQVAVWQAGEDGPWGADAQGVEKVHSVAGNGRAAEVHSNPSESNGDSEKGTAVQGAGAITSERWA